VLTDLTVYILYTETNSRLKVLQVLRLGLCVRTDRIRLFYRNIFRSFIISLDIYQYLYSPQGTNTHKKFKTKLHTKTSTSNTKTHLYSN